MDTTIWAALISVAGTLLGVWIGSLISNKSSRDAAAATHKNALQLIQITEFNRAASKFRDTFSPVLRSLIPPYEPLPDDLAAFLYRSFHDFKNAVIEFSGFLDDPKTKAAFLQSWYQYYCPDDNSNENCRPHFVKYSLRERTEEEKQDVKQLVRSRIEKILEFAKPK